jgi:hypothetical protein
MGFMVVLFQRLSWMYILLHLIVWVQLLLLLLLLWVILNNKIYYYVLFIVLLQKLRYLWYLLWFILINLVSCGASQTINVLVVFFFCNQAFPWPFTRYSPHKNQVLRMWVIISSIVQVFYITCVCVCEVVWEFTCATYLCDMRDLIKN